MMGFASTVHSGIYVLVLMLCVRPGSSAPHGRKNDRNSDEKLSASCLNIMMQIHRISGMLNDVYNKFH